MLGWRKKVGIGVGRRPWLFPGTRNRLMFWLVGCEYRIESDRRIKLEKSNPTSGRERYGANSFTQTATSYSLSLSQSMPQPSLSLLSSSGGAVSELSIGFAVDHRCYRLAYHAEQSQNLESSPAGGKARQTGYATHIIVC